MGPDNWQPETPAQWVEHSEAWRYAHLDLAPSELWRREAVAAHQRAAAAAASASAAAGGGGARTAPWFRLRRRHP
jgi:hypothetical protein